MTTITREQQKQILIDTANHVISRDNTSPYSENLRELARIALAALTAEPVAWKYRLVDINSGTGEHWKYSTQCITPTSGKTHCIESVPLYTAPPAPDNKQTDELVMWVKRLSHSLRNARPDSELHGAAMDYLSHKGLISVKDVLR
ncbi:hypothetical protein EGM30_19600 [Salmonella enterica subsp. enterica]|nr:hypothetical protein [Salmonella enterica subsp. enterica serovar Lisboa]